MSEEKCTESLPPLRLPSAMLTELKELAFRADRSVSDYVRWVLKMHVYGHARSVVEDSTNGHRDRASQHDARKPK